MPVRLSPFMVAPDPMNALLALEKKITGLGLEPRLVALVKIRASQINQCAYCLHMHTKEARAHGETEERLALLPAWRESPCYVERERAALAWTESLTLVATTGADDEAYGLVQAQFSEQEQVHLTLLIGMINTWNRICVGFRSMPSVPLP